MSLPTTSEFAKHKEADGHACFWTKEVASMAASHRREKDRLRDDADRLRRQINACDAGRQQMMRNCSDNVRGKCTIDQNRPCKAQCRLERVSNIGGELVYG